MQDKTAILLDLDRTIFDTSKFWDDVFDAVAKIYGAEKRVEYKSVCDDVYAATSMAMVEVACDRTGANATEIFNKISGKYLYNDAQKFMKSHREMFILSMGDDFTQNFKMRAAKLNLPTIIVDSHDKANWIMKNCFRSGKYYILDREFDTIELYDDKISNFIGFEKLPNVSGFLIQRSGNFSGNLPTNVTAFKSFDEL